MLRNQKTNNCKIEIEDNVYDDIEDDQDHRKNNVNQDYVYHDHYTTFNEIYDNIKEDHHVEYLEMGKC